MHTSTKSIQFKSEGSGKVQRSEHKSTTKETPGMEAQWLRYSALILSDLMRKFRDIASIKEHADEITELAADLSDKMTAQAEARMLFHTSEETEEDANA